MNREKSLSATVKSQKNKKEYATPTLDRHGTVEALTQEEYGGLDRITSGYLFAMSTPGMPETPNQS